MSADVEAVQRTRAQVLLVIFMLVSSQKSRVCFKMCVCDSLASIDSITCLLDIFLPCRNALILLMLAYGYKYDNSLYYTQKLETEDKIGGERTRAWKRQIKQDLPAASIPQKII